jgi:PAS domain S-box-containing protein
MVARIVERRMATAHRDEGDPDFRGIFATANVGIALLDRSGCAVGSNPTLQRMLGCSAEELLGKPVWKFARPIDGGADIDQLWRTLLGQSRRIQIESRFVSRTGETIGGRITLSRLRKSEDRRVFGAAVFEETSDHGLAASARSAGKALVDDVFASLGGYAAVIDRDGNVVAANEAWTRLVREMEGGALAAGVGTNYLDACRHAVASNHRNAAAALTGVESLLAGERHEYKMEYVCQGAGNGTERWLEMAVHPLRRPAGGAIISQTDITDRHRAELEARTMRRELSHLARVAMLGELTASLAHELSQPLMAILSNAQAAQRLLKAPSPDRLKLREALDDIVAGEERAGEIIRRVHNLLKRSNPEYRSLDLNALILEVMRFVRTDALAKSVAVQLRLAHGLPRVWGDGIQLQQVLLNLILNALDAMRDIPTGERRLAIASAQVDADTVDVCVEDTGTGIASELIDKLFDRFVTSKAHGLGMGLAISRSIIQGHGGRIWAKNLSCGAQFRFTLPVSGKAMR